MSSQELFELVETAAGYAGSLYRGLDKIVEDLREDNFKKGLSAFAQAIEGIEWLTNAVTIVNNDEEFGGFDVETANGFFSEMTEAAENMDYVLLTDLIEYEILPIIDDWGKQLDDILVKQL